MDEIKHARPVVKHANTEVKHKDTGGVTSIYMGAGEMKENGKIYPRRLEKAFFNVRNDKKVCGSDLHQHEKHITNLLINRVKSNKMQFY